MKIINPQPCLCPSLLVKINNTFSLKSKLIFSLIRLASVNPLPPPNKVLTINNVTCVVYTCGNVIVSSHHQSRITHRDRVSHCHVSQHSHSAQLTPSRHCQYQIILNNWRYRYFVTVLSWEQPRTSHNHHHRDIVMLKVTQDGRVSSALFSLLRAVLDAEAVGGCCINSLHL